MELYKKSKLEMFQVPGNYSMAEYLISYLRLVIPTFLPGSYSVPVVIPTFLLSFTFLTHIR